MVKLKGKVLPVHAMKSCKETGSKLHSFLTSAVVCGEWLLHVPVIFTLQKQLLYPLNKRVGGRQRRFGLFWTRGNVSCHPVVLPPLDRPASRLITLPTELSRLLFNTKLIKQLTQALKLLICNRKIPSSEPDRTLTTPVRFSVIFPTRK